MTVSPAAPLGLQNCVEILFNESMVIADSTM